MEAPVGSLVVPAPAFRESMETGEGAALLLAQKRGSGHLYYPATDQGFWVPARHIRAIPPEAVPPGCRERFLSELFLELEAEEIVLEEVGDDTMALTIDFPGFTRAGVGMFETRLGDQLGDYALEPGSMRVCRMRLRLVSLPDAAGAGT